MSFICFLSILIGIKNKMKFLIVIIILTLNIPFLKGQVDRKNAKFMDTCTVKVAVPEVLDKKEITDSTNNFQIKCNCNLLEYKIKFFDRWGNSVLVYNNINDPIRIIDLKVGAYVWIVDAKYPNGKRETKNGVLKITEQ